MKLILLVAVATMAACQHTQEDPWAGKLYVGDATKAAVVRGQTGEVVAATSEPFNEMICMAAVDFEHFAERFHYFTEQCIAAGDESVAAPDPEVDTE